MVWDASTSPAISLLLSSGLKLKRKDWSMAKREDRINLRFGPSLFHWGFIYQRRHLRVALLRWQIFNAALEQ